MTRVSNHPIRGGLDLMDGSWYADDPHEVWSWMRREAPVYFDPVSKVWGIAKHEDVLAIEKPDLLRWSDDMLRATSSEMTPEMAEAGAAAMAGFREVHESMPVVFTPTPRSAPAARQDGAT